MVSSADPTGKSDTTARPSELSAGYAHREEIQDCIASERDGASEVPKSSKTVVLRTSLGGIIHLSFLQHSHLWNPSHCWKILKTAHFCFVSGGLVDCACSPQVAETSASPSVLPVFVV